MGNTTQQLVERIQNDDCLAIHKEGQARVIAVMSDGYTMYGDVINNIVDSTHARDSISSLCVGAQKTLGNRIYVAFRGDGELCVMYYNEFLKMFPVKEYESPIAL